MNVQSLVGNNPEYKKFKKGSAVIALLAVLALNACNSDEPDHAAAPTPVTATAETPTSEQSKELAAAIKSSTPVTFFRGDLILVRPDGISKAVVNPLIMAKPGVTTPGTDVLSDYDFFAVVARGEQTAVTVQVEPVNLDGFSAKLNPSEDETPVGTATAKTADEPLLNSPEIFDLAANENYSSYGYNIASFGYHTIGNAYFVANEEEPLPLGILLEGRAINHQ